MTNEAFQGLALFALIAFPVVAFGLIATIELAFGALAFFDWIQDRRSARQRV
jgi:hypothetical protein